MSLRLLPLYAKKISWSKQCHGVDVLTLTERKFCLIVQNS